MLPPLRENTDDELTAFERVCEQLAGFDDRLQPEWLDGFLTGMLAGPRRIEAAEWMGRLFGDAFERAFADPAAVAEAMSALTARVKVIASQLDAERLVERPDAIYLSPLMWSLSDEERARLVAEGEISAEEDAAWAGPGEEWAHGFLDAVEAFEADWTLDASDEEASGLLDELLLQVDALTYAAGSDALAEHLSATYPEATEPPTRDDLIDEACMSIQEMRVFWIDHAKKPATRTVAKTPGRNEPCPCGSGKKYKKCHGA